MVKFKKKKKYWLVYKKKKQAFKCYSFNSAMFIYNFLKQL